MPVKFFRERKIWVALALPMLITPPAAAEETAASASVNAHSHAGAYLAGRFAEQHSDYRTASHLLDRLMEDNPGDLALRRRAFLSHLRAGNFERAEDLAGQIAAKDLQPFSTALVTLTATNVRSGDWETALQNADRIPVSGLARYAAPLLRSWAHAGAGDTAKAVDALKPLSDNGGFDRLRALHEGLIFARAEQYDAALAALTKEGENIQDAPLRLILLASRIHRSTGNTAEAEKILSAYLEKYPNTDTVQSELAELRDGKTPPPFDTPAQGVADGFYHLASGVRQQSDEIAMVYGRISSLLNPDFDLPYLLVGTILEDRDRYSEAIETLRMIKPESEYSWDARLAIADNMIDLDKDEEAIAFLEEMAAERTGSTDPLVKIGYVMRADKRYLEEVEIYNRAIARIDGDPVRRHWLLFYNRGIAFERSKQWPEAESDFLKALDLKPDDPFVLNYLGYSWVEQGSNIGLAKEMIRKAVDQRQGDGYIVDSLGWVLFRTGQYDEAVGHLERAVQLRPQDPVINDHLGDAYWQVGRQNEARFQWDRALNLEPEEHLVPAIKDKLSNGMPAPEVIQISN